MGAWAVEVECVPEKILSELTQRTNMLTISIGAGISGDVQFLFAEDILGHNPYDTPRHAKIYRNFSKIFQNMQKERINAFKDFKRDVYSNIFPTKKNIINIDKRELKNFIRFLKENHN